MSLNSSVQTKNVRLIAIGTVILMAALFMLALSSRSVSADFPVASVAVGTDPRGIAVDKTTNHIYIVNRLSRDVSVVDGNTNTVVTTIPVGVSPSPLP